MTTVAGSQRLTIFLTDDVTPLLGAVDGGGNVTEPTCSTNPQYLRPYMKQILQTAQATIDFKNGAAVIGQLTAEILDKRRTATDQTTGWFTNILAASGTQNTQLLGRRCLVEQQATDGSWYVLLNGVIYSVALDQTLVTYNLIIRDIRERERDIRLFVSSQHAILPWGPAQGFGTIPQVGGGFNYVMPPVGGLKAVYHSAAKTFILDKPITVDDTYWKNLGPFMYGIVSAFPYAAAGYWQQKFLQVGVRWAAWNDSYQYYNNPFPSYTTLNNMDIGILPLFIWQNTGDRVRGFQRSIVGINVDTTLTLPADGTVIWLQVVSNDLPTSDAPLYLSLNFGQLLKNIYDGVYSDPGADPVWYDSTAMTAFIAATPQANLVLTAPVADRRTWVEENIYKPLGYAPALNSVGRIVPIKYSIPDPSVSLMQLDDSNVIEAEWSHDQAELVTRVDFTYKRDYGVQGFIGNYTQLSLLTRDVIVSRISVDTTVFGEFILDYKPETIRSVSNQLDGSAQGGDIQQELGMQLAVARGIDAINRFSQGAQKVVMKVRRSQAGVQALNVGDWVIVACSWLPDYITGVRGINRLAQIITLQDADNIHRAITVLDAGPYGAPVSNATVSTITPNNTTNQIEVVVTAIPAIAGKVVMVEAQYAIDVAQPSNTSGDWVHMSTVVAPGTMASVTLPPSVTAWVRYRTAASGMRPSAWSNAVSVTFTSTPQIKQVSLTLNLATRTPLAQWAAIAGVLGVRVYYLVQAASAAPPTSLTSGTFVDVDASLQFKILTVGQITDAQICYAQLVPYSGFTAGNCTGTPGPATKILNTTNLVALTATIKPSATENTSTGVGTLSLVINDPNLDLDQTLRIEFYRTVIGVRTLVAPTTQPGSGTTGTFTLDSTLDGKHNVMVEPLVHFADGTSEILGAWTFDSDKISDVVATSVSYLGNTATAKITFDTDTVVGANKARWRIGAGSFTTIAVAGDLTASFSLACTAFSQTIEVVGQDSDGNWGHSAFFLVTGLNGLPTSVITIGNNQSVSDLTAKAAALINASEDVYDIRWLASTSSFPSQSSTASTGAIVTRASGGAPFTIADLGVNLSLGDTVYLSIQPRDAAGSFSNLNFIQVQATRANINATKTIRLPAASVLTVYDSATQTSNVSNGYYSSGTLVGNVGFLPVPKGCTLLAVRARVYAHSRSITNDFCNLFLFRVDNDGATTQLGSTAQTSTVDAWETIAVTSLTEDTSGNRSYSIEEIGVPGAGIGTAEQRCAWLEYDITAPTLFAST